MAANDVWTCCQCKAANLEANSPTKCPACGKHDKCPQCPRGRQGLSSSTPTEMLIPSCPDTIPRYIPPLYIDVSTCSISTMQPWDFSHGTSDNTYTDYSARSEIDPGTTVIEEGSAFEGYVLGRPSMRGWWVCSNCTMPNNPELAPQRCPNCGHYRSTCCTTLRS